MSPEHRRFDSLVQPCQLQTLLAAALTMPEAAPKDAHGSAVAPATRLVRLCVLPEYVRLLRGRCYLMVPSTVADSEFVTR
eukprot:2264408-Prymnesium_polylepis.2